MSELRVFTNDTDTVVAADLADAQRVVEAHYGVTFEQEGWSLDEWCEVPGDKLITIRDDDRVIWRPVGDTGSDGRETKTAAEWAMSNGRGFLCSTEY